MENLYRKTHSAICGGAGTYTSETPCTDCGSQLFQYGVGCHSCDQRDKTERKYLGHSDQYAKRIQIDRMREQRALERELSSYV